MASAAAQKKNPVTTGGVELSTSPRQMLAPVRGQNVGGARRGCGPGSQACTQPRGVPISGVAVPYGSRIRERTTILTDPAKTDRRAKIRARAYAIWEQEGRPDGKELEHWVQAKRLIAAEELCAAAETPTQFLRKPLE